MPRRTRIEARKSMTGADKEGPVRLFPEARGINVVPQQTIGAVISLDRSIGRDQRNSVVAPDPGLSLTIASDHESVVAGHSLGLGKVCRGDAACAKMKTGDSVGG